MNIQKATSGISLIALLLLPLFAAADSGLPSDGIASHSTLRCAVGEPPKNLQVRTLLSQFQPEVKAWREIDLFVVTAPDFSRGIEDTEVAEQVLQTIEGANRFLRDLKLQLRLVGLDINADDKPSIYDGALAARDPYAMLGALRQDGKTRSFNGSDVTLVLAKSRFKDIYGLSYVASSCVFPSLSYLFVTQGGEYAGARARMAATLAHELGHFVGMYHDDPQLATPSLMSSHNVMNPNGFSDVSKAQYLDFAGSDQTGGSCFSEIPAPAQSSVAESDLGFSFLSGSRQRIELAENEDSYYPIQVANHEQHPGISYDAMGLPPSAKLNPITGLIHFTPDYRLAQSRHRSTYTATVTARMFGASVQAKLKIKIRNFNRAPVIETPGEIVTMEEGVPGALEITARDPDAGDSIKRLSVHGLKALKTARLFSTSRTAKTIYWESPVPGIYPLLVRAADHGRAKNIKTLTIIVVPTSSD